MNKPNTCPKCGEALEQCENCETFGCPTCNEEWVVTRDEVLLCPECSAEIKAEYNKVTENGTKVCGSCACFKHEDANGCGECDHHDVPENYFEVRHCFEFCGNWTQKTA